MMGGFVLLIGLLFHVGCIEAYCREERWFDCKQGCPHQWTQTEHHNSACCSSFWSCGGWNKKCRDDWSCADIDRIEFDLNNVKPSESEAVFGKKISIDNPHGVARDGAKIGFEQEVTEETWFEHEVGLQVTVGTHFSVGIPEVVEVGGSIEVTGSTAYRWGERNSRTWRHTYETSLNVGPFERVECQAFITETEFGVPYTIYYKNGRTSSGTFHSVTVGSVTVKYTRHPIHSDNCNVKLHRTNGDCLSTKPVTQHKTENVNTAAKCAGYVWGECTKRGFFQWRSSDNSCLCVEDNKCERLTTGNSDIYRFDCTSKLDYCEDFEDSWKLQNTCYNILLAGDCDTWYEFCSSTCCLNDFVLGDDVDDCYPLGTDGALICDGDWSDNYMWNTGPGTVTAVCRDGYHACGLGGNIDEVRQYIKHPHCSDLEGIYVAAIAHAIPSRSHQCQPNDPDPSRQFFEDFGCPTSGWGSEPICCGTGCSHKSPGCPGHGLSDGLTGCQCGSNGCGNFPSRKADGVLCCPDA